MNRGTNAVDPLARGLLLGQAMADGKTVTSKFIRETFGVSPATAKRDMLAIEVTLRPHVDVQTGSRERRLISPKGHKQPTPTKGEA